MIHVTKKVRSLLAVTTPEVIEILDGVRKDLWRAHSRMLLAYESFEGGSMEFYISSGIVNVLGSVEKLRADVQISWSMDSRNPAVERGSMLLGSLCPEDRERVYASGIDKNSVIAIAQFLQKGGGHE